MIKSLRIEAKVFNHMTNIEENPLTKALKLFQMLKLSLHFIIKLNDVDLKNPASFNV